MKGLLLIDGSLLAYRCHEAMPDLSNAGGTPTGLEYGFLRTIESLQRKYPQFELVLVWDCPTAKQKAAKIDPQYKANRQPSEDKRGMWRRVESLRERVLDNVWSWAFQRGVEADAIMFDIAMQATDKCLLYTNDEDLLQTIEGDRVVQLKSHRSTIYEWDEEKVREKFGVRPYQLPLLRACLGDKSDNLPGCGCLNRGKLAEAVRDCTEIKHAGDRTCPVPDRLVEYMPTRPNWFGPKTSEKWKAFVDSGQLHRNFKLMQLTALPQEVLIDPPLRRAEPVVEALLEWEIRTLKLCSVFLAGTSAEEEF